MNAPARIPVAFECGGYQLRGVLHAPAGNGYPAVIGSHGLFSSSESPKQIAIAEQCVKAGIAYFRFDHRGCGNSSGDFAEATTVEGRRNDLLQAVEIIRDMTGAGERIGLLGSSLGGAVVLSAVKRIDPEAIVTIAAPLRFDFKAAVGAIRKAGEYQIPSPSFYEKDLTFDVSGEIDGIKNILAFHGELDIVIPVAHARELFEKAAFPKKLIIQTGGDHRISERKHQIEFMEETVEWFKQRLFLS